MDPENVMNLFDFLWFNHEILKKNIPNDHSWVKTHESEVKFSSLRSILVRSQSEDIGSSFNYGSFSPNSVLKSIPSGNNLDFKTPKQEQEVGMSGDQGEMMTHLTSIRKNKDATFRKTLGSEPETTMVVDRIEQRERKKNKKRRCGTSKSLSDLEFEELKGFMDMGFVFSEQDKDSRLVEIIPGLQRLGEEGEREQDDEDEDENDDDGDERRPYLSEAWDDLDRRLEKKERKEPPPVMKWEIPAFRDEIDMKDNLKLWAHTVASFVR